MLGLWARHIFRHGRHISLYIVPMILGTSSRLQFPSPLAIICCCTAHSTGSSLLLPVGTVVFVLHEFFLLFSIEKPAALSPLLSARLGQHAITWCVCVSPPTPGRPQHRTVGRSQRCASSCSKVLRMEKLCVVGVSPAS